MERIRLANECLSLTLAMRGGAVEAFHAETAEGPVPVFFRGGSGGQPVCFPLVPFANRLRGNRFDFEGRSFRLTPNTAGDPLYLHGDGWLAAWALQGASATEATLAFDHAEPDRCYAYRAVQHFSLEGPAMRIRLSVTNTGPSRMPFGLGLHPFLPLTARTEIAFEAGHFWEQDDAFLPTRRRPASGAFDFSRARTPPRHWMNTEFEGWSGRALVRWPETGGVLRIAAAPPLGRCMLFLPTAAFDPGYAGDWFCFEPMTHGVDAHHRPDGGLVPLGPGESMTAQVAFEYGSER